MIAGRFQRNCWQFSHPPRVSLFRNATVPPNTHGVNEGSPFQAVTNQTRTISISMMMFAMVLFAGFSLLLMSASRVPAIANSINDFFGLPQTAKPDKPDRSAHLFFLLFCYSSPLLFAMLVGVLHWLKRRFGERMTPSTYSSPRSTSIDSSDSPFA